MFVYEEFMVEKPIIKWIELAELQWFGHVEYQMMNASLENVVIGREVIEASLRGHSRFIWLSLIHRIEKKNKFRRLIVRCLLD